MFIVILILSTIFLCIGCIFVTYRLTFRHAKKIGVLEEREKWEKEITLDQIVKKIAERIGRRVGTGITQEMFNEMRHLSGSLKRFPIEPGGIIVGGDELLRELALLSRIRKRFKESHPDREFDSGAHDILLWEMELVYNAYVIFKKSYPQAKINPEAHEIILTALAVLLPLSKNEQSSP